MSPSAVFSSIAQSGFSKADSYDAHRPSYNPKAVELLLSSLKLLDKPEARIAEIASGTGKFTALISARPENYEIVAVEPHPQMVGVLRSKELRGVTVREGNATAIPIEDGWADAVIVAQVYITYSLSLTFTTPGYLEYSNSAAAAAPAWLGISLVSITSPCVPHIKPLTFAL
jgi:SAM-dependent methyltransferase